jgi:predicted RND superfamily exporter protein
VRRLLDLIAAPATRAPIWTLAVLALVTVGFGALASQLEVSTDLGDFAPEGGLQDTLQGIDDRFGAGDTLQLVVDTGPGGDLLTAGGLAAGEDLAERLRTHPDLVDLLAPDRLDQPAVLTYAEPFAVASDLLGQPLEELDDSTVDTLARSILDDPVGAQAASLLSDDLEREPPRARGGIGLVELRPGLDHDQLETATAATQEVAAGVTEHGVRVGVLGDIVIESALEDGINRDIPVLMSLSLLLVVGVLSWLFRSVSDVVVGLAGLLASIVWMAGAAAALGPGLLGLVGPFGQVAIAVPVLLVGLGVDYSVHLTTRYREQQGRGDGPERAAVVSLRIVGVALVLATVATVGGFLANLATPLPPIADLGIFAAIGILAAFVIFSFAVPATRVAIDRWRGARGAAAPEARPARWTDVLTRAAVHHPAVVLVVTSLLLLAGGVSAAGLGTEFDERSFLPEGAAVTATIDRTDTLFGGDVGEQTYILVEGDATDPSFLALAASFQDRLGDVAAVRRVGDRPQVSSPFELVDRLGDRGLRVRDDLAADLAVWADPATAADELPLPDELPTATLEEEAPEGADVPAEVLDAVARRLPEGRSPSVALATSSDPAVIREAIRDAFRDDLLADRPAGLSDAALAELADVPADGLELARLQAAGYPLDALDEADRDALERLDRLEAAGWEQDGPSRAPDDVAAQIAVAADALPDELATTLDDDGALFVASTSAGQDAASELAAELRRQAEDLVAAGGEVDVVSAPLINEEIIDSLSAAQLLAIVISISIAAVLLVVATLVSDRSVALGLIGTAPAVVALVLVLGTMRLIGLSFNALTATVASIAIGIGVPYGIHLTNRFRASLATEPDVPAAVADTLRHTGGALTGSAVTTGLAFGVLGLSTSVPLRQFGIVAAMMITYALLACLLLQPTLLAWWARRRGRRRLDEPEEPVDRDGDAPAERASVTAGG